MGELQSVVKETKALVQKEIKNKDNHPDFTLEKQLYLILEELDKMERIRGIRLFHPYYPGGIADSQDCSSPLTTRLLESLESCQELQ